MSSKRYISALIYYTPGSHFSTDNEVYITMVAPMVGVLVGVTIEVGCPIIVGYIRKKLEKRRLNSPRIIPVTINSNGNNLSILRKTLDRVTTSKIIRPILIVYKHLALSPVLRIVVISLSQIVNAIIICRFGLLIKDACIYAYKKRNRENFIKIAAKTLCWIVASKERDRMVKYLFGLVSTITTLLWLTKNPIIRRGLQIWLSFTLLNLAQYIYVEPSFSRYRPSDMGVFGLPRVEHLMKPLGSFSETPTNSRLSMIGKEETSVISSPLQNEMPKSVYKDFESEMKKIIKDSTLDEKNTIVPRKVELQKEESSIKDLTPKRRVNNLQNLNKADFPDRVKAIENGRKIREKLYNENFEKLPDLTKIKE